LVVKIAHLEDSLSEIFKLEASPVEGQSEPQKDQKGKKMKGEEKLKNLKSLKV